MRLKGSLKFGMRALNHRRKEGGHGKRYARSSFHVRPTVHLTSRRWSIGRWNKSPNLHTFANSACIRYGNSYALQLSWMCPPIHSLSKGPSNSSLQMGPAQQPLNCEMVSVEQRLKVANGTRTLKRWRTFQFSRSLLSFYWILMNFTEFYCV